MVFEFSTDGGPLFMQDFAKFLGTSVTNGVIRIPARLGKGFVRIMDLGICKLIVNSFTFNQELIIRRLAARQKQGVVIMYFQHVLYQQPPEPDDPRSPAPRRPMPSVQVASNDFALDSRFPAKREINSIVIAIRADILKGLLTATGKNILLDTILADKQSFIYDEPASPEIRNVSAEIMHADPPALLRDFYYKRKAEELIYLLLAELLKRQGSSTYSVNLADAKMMYAIRTRILSDLGMPPSLPDLARFAGMSESKLKRMFRQIFGNSIYRYYQSLRMDEAAHLIKNKRLSISEAGYRLGFSNLSHFTRLFEKHLGIKPKKFSRQ